jgi:hypothetical protein
LSFFHFIFGCVVFFLSIICWQTGQHIDNKKFGDEVGTERVWRMNGVERGIIVITAKTTRKKLLSN